MSPKKAFIIFTADQQALAERIAASFDADMIALDSKAPKSPAPLLMPLLSEAMLDAWEGSTIGEWAMECMDQPNVKLLPILAEECEWQDSLFFGLPLLPHARVPLDNPRFWTMEKALTQLEEDVQSELTPTAPIQKGGFKRAALKLIWRTMPTKWKWIGGIGLASILTLLLWMVLG